MNHNVDEQILIHFHNVEFYRNDHDQYDVVYLLILEPKKAIRKCIPLDINGEKS